eukprot:COSAG01_NODE_13706_length_1545_cov_4.065007_2_plen_125_part_00
MGTITNGNADAWAVPGLRDVIHFAVDAHSAGAAKPAPPVFHLALTKAAEVGDGCTVIEPSEVVHIGDDLTSDVRGAQGVGFRTVWYCPPPPRGAGPAAAQGAPAQRQPAPPRTQPWRASARSWR